MSKFLTDQWSEIKKWWSMWAGVLTLSMLAAVPVIAERWPDLAPAFIALFPKNGEQWAPIIGVALTVLARIVSQAAVLDALRKIFRRKAQEGDDAAA